MKEKEKEYQNKSLLQRIVDVDAWYNKVEANIGVVFLFIMMFVMSFQVIQRFIFKSGNTWSEELSRYIYIWFTLITVSYAILHNAHIKVDACMAVWPKKIRPVIVVIGLLIIMAYCVLMVVFGIKMVRINLEMGNKSLGLHLQMGLVYLITPLSHVLIFLRCAQRLIMIYLGEDMKALDEAEEAIKAA